MGSPERKKRKTKKSKHSSSSQSRSYSSENSYDRHHSHRKHRKSKAKNYSPSRERSRSDKKYKRQNTKEISNDQIQNIKTKPSPTHYQNTLWPSQQDLVTQQQQQAIFNQMPQMPGMGVLGGLPNMGGIGFPPFFQQRIPLQLPTPSNYKPNKTTRTIKNPKTQFKGRVYIPYTFDLAMVTFQDPYIQKEIGKPIINQLCMKVIQQTEKRAREQKQDEIVMKKIQNLQEEMTEHIKLLPIKRKKGDNTDNKQKLSQIGSLLQISQGKSLDHVLQHYEDQLDSELVELISQLGIRSNKNSEIDKELEPSQLMKEAKDLYKSIKV